MTIIETTDESVLNNIMIPLVSSIHEYYKTLLKLVHSHRFWEREDTIPHNMDLILEVFLYSKCHDVIFEILERCSMKDTDRSMDRQFETLQNISPSNPDIAFYKSVCDENISEKELDLPIFLLKSIENLISPTQITMCILDVYKEINNVFRHIMERKKKGTNIPGADDILPVLIFTTIRAKPARITF